MFDNKKVFETAKPIGLIEKILAIGSANDDLIVDFFSGSATTAHAIMRSNIEKKAQRKYILVQLKEPVKEGSEAEKAGYKTIDQLGMDRIKNAAHLLREQNPDASADLGFKHYTLAEVNQNTLDKSRSLTIAVSSQIQLCMTNLELQPFLLLGWYMTIMVL